MPTLKSLAGLITEDWTYVVAVCDDAVEACPVFVGAECVLYWPFPDPADVSGSSDERMIAFRETRDAIKRRVGEFLRELNVN